MIPFLGPLDPFPPVTEARQEMNGLLAVGGQLLPDRLLDAYRHGIFPWGTVEGQALWYSPDPRMVLFPENFRLSRSLRRLLRSATLTISADRDFPAVIAACAATRRRGQDGTWISDEMMEAYIRLHELGWAHSVEAWEEGELVGGLYGLAIGRMFYGESMFSRRDNASKFAFAYLIRLLRERGFGMIDCQMYTDHLASLGAAEIPRSEFLQRMHTLIGQGERSAWQLAATADW
jgi:leucyl/phenylalanyl-tRNA--protein transferase